MIDTLQTLRSYLAGKSAITSLVGTRIYAGRAFPPKSYTPGLKALAFNGRGGQIDYTSQFLSESVQFKCYGSDEVDAMGLYRMLVDTLHDGSGSGIRHAELEISGYPLQEPDTDWHYVLTYFTILYESGL